MSGPDLPATTMPSDQTASEPSALTVLGGTALAEPIVIRKGFVRQLLPGGKIGAQGNRAYYEVCTDVKLLDLARKKISTFSPKN